jgi:hypothetical protein
MYVTIIFIKCPHVTYGADHLWGVCRGYRVPNEGYSFGPKGYQCIVCTEKIRELILSYPNPS